MRIRFYKADELKGASYVKLPLRSSAILNIEKTDIYCFIWSIVAFLHPCGHNHPTGV